MADVAPDTRASNAAKADGLMKATRDRFAKISPWAGAASTTRAAQEVMQPLHEEADRYSVSMAQRWKKARAGHSLAEKATELCDNLLKPEVSDGEIQALITKMRDIAQKAHKDATATAGGLHSNIRGLHSVVARVPVEDVMNSDHKKEKMNEDKAEHKAETWKNKIFSIGNKRGKNQKLLVASPLKRNGQHRDKEADYSKNKGSEEESDMIPSELYISEALDSLPVTLPLLIVAKTRQSSLEAQTKEIDRKMVTITTEMKSFNGVTTRLGPLAEKLNTTPDYWLVMDSVLEDLHHRVHELRNNATLHIEINSLAEDWRQVGMEYFAYKRQVAALNDTGPQIQATTEGKKGLSATFEQPSAIAGQPLAITIEPPGIAVQPSASTTQPPTSRLDEIMVKMTSHMEEILASLYAVQTAAGSARKAPDYAPQFKAIRESIYINWGAIVQVLRKCAQFGNEITKLPRLAPAFNKEVVVALVQKRLPNFEKGGFDASDLIRQHDLSFQHYSQYADQFRATIRRASSKGKRMRDLNIHTNGEEDMITFQKEYMGLRVELVNLSTFFEDKIATYKRYLATADGYERDISTTVKDWGIYMGSIKKAMLDIQRYSDAIIIPPNTLKVPDTGTKCIIC